jgi:hypothetical protein
MRAPDNTDDKVCAHINVWGYGSEQRFWIMWASSGNYGNISENYGNMSGNYGNMTRNDMNMPGNFGNTLANCGNLWVNYGNWNFWTETIYRNAREHDQIGWEHVSSKDFWSEKISLRLVGCLHPLRFLMSACTRWARDLALVELLQPLKYGEEFPSMLVVQRKIHWEKELKISMARLAKLVLVDGNFYNFFECN